MSTGDGYETIVIGGGQAGLAAGYFLARQGKQFLILDENKRSGEAWRKRWESLRLFTPAKYDGLPGQPFPGADFYYPTRDEVANYLEDYARQFALPVRNNVRVEKLARNGQGYRLETVAGEFAARNVIVATGPYQKPHTPAFARQLDPAILQLHSSAYCNPQQIPVENVLVVGAGNSGAEIALELAQSGKRVWLAGRDVGRIPADILGRVLGGRPYWWFTGHVLSDSTPIGRKMKAQVLFHGAPLIHTSRQEVTAAGVERAPRVAGVQAGKPLLDDERTLPVEAVLWATGFRPDYGWIDLTVFGEGGYPRHARGVIPGMPGLYFVGLPFQKALNSAFLGGVGADAEYIVGQIQ